MSKICYEFVFSVQLLCFCIIIRDGNISFCILIKYKLIVIYAKLKNIYFLVEFHEPFDSWL